MSDHTPITLCLEDLRHLFDLATDSPLMCSGSFENIDVDLLRKIAILINVDPETVTPDQFIRDYPHTFEPKGVQMGYMRIDEGPSLYSKYLRNHRRETDEERTARLERSDWQNKPCAKGTGYRVCGRPMNHEIHTGNTKEKS